jgi:hypothetical protein
MVLSGSRVEKTLGAGTRKAVCAKPVRRKAGSERRGGFQAT